MKYQLIDGKRKRNYDLVHKDKLFMPKTDYSWKVEKINQQICLTYLLLGPGHFQFYRKINHIIQGVNKKGYRTETTDTSA